MREAAAAKAAEASALRAAGEARFAAEAALAAAAAESQAALAAAAAESQAALAAAARAVLASEARAASPEEAKRTAHRAFLAAEAWRQELVGTLYANMSDADWDTAARWKRYADPSAPARTCAVAELDPQLLGDIALLQRTAAALPPLANRSRAAYLALHAFHTTGLEGNTLTLPETLLTVAGQPLFAGFDARVLPSRAKDLSTTEAHNVAQLWDGLGLSALPSRAAPPPLDLARLSAAALIDMNSAITRGTGALFGLRARPVAIGHQRVLMPMPDEVPFLVNEFLAWLAAELRAAEGPPAAASEGTPLQQLQRALSLACDAHTRFVFVHPFADGNGRLARTLSALVLQRAALPAAMVPRGLRAEYMEAVSGATVRRDYAPLAAIHAAAVRRSLACLLLLAEGEGGGGSGGASGVRDALRRGDCALAVDG
jgi:hypothetical protein